MPDSAPTIIATLVSTFGLVALWTAWRHRPGRHWGRVIAAWTAIASALALHGWSGDGERGAAIGFLLLMATALVMVMATAALTYVADRPAIDCGRPARVRDVPAPGGPHTRLTKALAALGMAAVSGAASLLLTLLAYRASAWFGLAPADRVALTFVVWPVLWSLFCATQLLSQRSGMRRMTGVAIIGVASLAALGALR